MVLQKILPWLVHVAGKVPDEDLGSCSRAASALAQSQPLEATKKGHRAPATAGSRRERAGYSEKENRDGARAC